MIVKEIRLCEILTYYAISTASTRYGTFWRKRFNELEKIILLSDSQIEGK